MYDAFETADAIEYPSSVHGRVHHIGYTMRTAQSALESGKDNGAEPVPSAVFETMA